MTYEIISKEEARVLSACVAKAENLLSPATASGDGRRIAYDMIREDSVFSKYRLNYGECDEPTLESILLEAKSDLVAYESSQSIVLHKNPLLEELRKSIMWPIIVAIILAIAAVLFKARVETQFLAKQKQLEYQFLEKQKRLDIKSQKELQSFRADYDRTVRLVEDLIIIQKEVYSLRTNIMKQEVNKSAIRFSFKNLRDKVQELEREFYSKTQYLPYPQKSEARRLRIKAILHLKRVFLCLTAKLRGGSQTEWDRASKEMGRILTMLKLNNEEYGDFLINPDGESSYGQFLDPGVFESLSSETNNLLFELLGSKIYRKSDN